MSQQFAQVEYDVIKLKGGWDQATPTLDLPSGFVRDALNFECNLTGGYTRIAGYERFDGHTSPSTAVYATVFISGNFTNTPVSGDTLTGGTSGATGTVIATGSAGANQYVAVTKKSGSYTVGETVSVGAGVVGTVIVPTQGITAVNHASYTALAADVYRADISAVPGSNAALGAILFNDVIYAFRANSGGTAVDLYKSSAAGWVNVPFYKEVYFTAGTTEPAEGATLTQGGVTATIKRVVIQSGAWTGTAAGKFIITTPSGGNFAAGAATATGGTTITLSAVEAAITFATGGVNGSKFEMVMGNFAGGVATNRVYGCDGVNRAFEFDGDILVPIDTGLGAADAPKHIAVHASCLFLAVGASLTGSSPGEPYNYQAISNAFEVGAGEVITGLKVLPGSSNTATLLVTSHSNTFMLYGQDTTDFNFVTYNSGAGSMDYTIQNMADTYMMDDRGLVSLKTSLNFGNFEQNTLSFRINQFISQHRTKVSCSTLDRQKSQYRIFFNDGFGLYLTMVNGSMVGIMPVYFPNPVFHADEKKYADGEEASFFCSTDGFVYQLDKGSSFDGAVIDAFITMNWNAINNTRLRKRFRKAAIEVSGNSYSEINFGYFLGYASSQISQPNATSYANNLQATVWDSFVWDSFVWDGRTLTPTECEMSGTAENVAITIRSGTAYFQPYTVNSIVVHYTNRRGMR